MAIDMDIDSSNVGHDDISADKEDVGDGLECRGEGEVSSSASWSSFFLLLLMLFCPFFFFVVKVVGLSSVYIVVGVRCLFGRLRL